MEGKYYRESSIKRILRLSKVDALFGIFKYPVELLQVPDIDMFES